MCERELKETTNKFSRGCAPHNMMRLSFKHSWKTTIGYVPEENRVPVSYTHLDVYKRQGFLMNRLNMTTNKKVKFI